MSEVLLIGVCGGSGSGKTTLAKNLQQLWGEEKSSILYQDSYYIDQSKNFDHDGGSINYDHPSSIDFQLMYEDLKKLKWGKDIDVPVYDFETHARKKEKKFFASKKIILIDGILIFSQEAIVNLLDYRVFVDTPESIRLERRIERDTTERGRTKEGVLSQFFAHVKPMHDEFIEPFKEQSSAIVSGLRPIPELVKFVDQKVLRH